MPTELTVILIALSIITAVISAARKLFRLAVFAAAAAAIIAAAKLAFEFMAG